MKQTLLLLFFLLATLPLGFGQQPDTDLSVQLSATIDSNTPSVTINWIAHPDASSYQIYRKEKGETSWGSFIGQLDGTETSFTDTDVSVGGAYEYRVIKFGDTQAYGYIFAGMELPVVEYRGRLLLLIDSSYQFALEDELKRLILDLEGDGWEVRSNFISPSQSVMSVKDTVVNWYNENPDSSETLFLLGHIPVPYSGNIFPDGHTDHQGAWPADGFYGDIDGTWTDQTINNTVANDPRNDNIPGDGKFDQSVIPSDIELQVGRVDLSDLPAFADNEIELTRQYLNKNHEFRLGLMPVVERAMIENNFPSFAEGFAQNGWKNFSTMFSPDSVSYQDYLSTLTAENYLWSYGCGAGSYTSCGGVVNTNQFASDSVQSVFTVLFGSYFGDWDRSNNLLRAALGSGNVLANFWAGRPNWQVHHMAMGETIGYGTRLSQNNSSSLYTTGFGARSIHIGLMGDPTLRMHNDRRPSFLDLTEASSHVSLQWGFYFANPDVIGYHVYRKETGASSFERINEELLPFSMDFYAADSCLQKGTNYTYMVRVVKLVTSASGSYYNMSTGIMDTITIKEESDISASSTLANGDTPGSVILEINSPNAVSVYWDFGNGETSTQFRDTVTYPETGIYTVISIATNNCGKSDTSYRDVNITIINTNQPHSISELEIYPNPSNTSFSIISPTLNRGNVFMYSLTGNLIHQKELNGNNNFVNIESVPKGMYLVKVEDEDKNWYITKLLVQ